MNRNTKIILIFLVSLAIVISAENIIFRVITSRERDKTNISLVIYEADLAWNDVKAGAELAAGDRAEVTVIELMDGYNVEGQYETIVNEFNNGADYVLTSAIDSSKLDELLNGEYSAKLCFLLNGVNSDNYITVAPNDHQMGYKLGSLATDPDKKERNVAVISANRNQKYIDERRAGVVEALDNAEMDYEFWTATNDEDICDFIESKIQDDVKYTILVLDVMSLGGTVKAASDVKNDLDIYAIANSDEAVYYLDSKQIDALVYPDKFGVGYAAVNNILEPDAYVNKNFSSLITNKVVRREDMYTGEYEKVLFPFVK